MITIYLHLPCIQIKIYCYYTIHHLNYHFLSLLLNQCPSALSQWLILIPVTVTSLDSFTHLLGIYIEWLLICDRRAGLMTNPHIHCIVLAAVCGNSFHPAHYTTRDKLPHHVIVGKMLALYFEECFSVIVKYKHCPVIIGFQNKDDLRNICYN